MELTTLVAAVAALGLPCSNPELRDCAAGELRWPAAYIRSIEGRNLLRRFAPAGVLDAGVRKDLRLDAVTASLPRVVVNT
jgi:hypothetical protein